MSGKPLGRIPGMKWFSTGSPGSFKLIVWILIIIVYILSLLDLIGWAFNIIILKSIVPYWEPMKIITSICFISAATALITGQMSLQFLFRRFFPRVIATFICLVSLITFYVYLFSILSGHESSLSTEPFLGFLLAPGMRMAFLTAFNFFLIGCILFLLSSNNKKAAGIAHLLIFPVMLASYFVLVSYILGVYPLNELPKGPIALNTGIAFCSICAVTLLIKPETWLMKVFTSDDTGGIFARRLLSGLMILPVVIGWFRIKGEQAGVYESEKGVVLVAMTYTFCFVCLIWIVARSVNRIDEKRRKSDESLKKSYAELDIKVKERTSELLDLNRKLNTEIIKRRKVQEEVNAERKRFNSLLELMPAYLILLTPDYHVSYANRYFRERFGKDRGMRCYEYLFNRTEPCIVCETFKVLKDHQPHTWEWTGPDGRFYSIFDFPFADTDDSPYIMEMGIDVTDLRHAETNLKNLNAILEQKVIERTQDLESANNLLHQELTDRILAEEALKRSEIRLRELNATKDKFFSIVAHDLKNPFTSLLGSSELLFQNIHQMDYEKIITLATILNDSAKIGYAILQNLLDWSRSQAGLLKINPEKINIYDLVDEHISNLQLQAANKKIKLYSEVAEKTYIYTDKNMINTVLRNLLSNAIKFTFRGGKVIISTKSDADKIIISIKDSGMGIPGENIDKLFNIDTKFSMSGTDNEQGTGLGLKLSKEFIEKLGGKIWVESIENKGSDFMFSVPVTGS